MSTQEAVKTCPTCGGDGEIGTRQDYWGMWETERCLTCWGEGEIPCKGAGTWEPTPDHDTPRSVLQALILCLIGGVIFIAAVTVGRAAMCDLHDQQVRYCPGYQAVSP